MDIRIRKSEHAHLIALHKQYLRAEKDKPDLSGADLRGAYLRGADLSEADLRAADLSGADLRAADLSEADLRVADLRGADLRGADLRGADLRGAYLNGAHLHNAHLNHSIVPKTGEFIAYKKLQANVIATLLIPKNAKRVGGLIGRKCRAEFVKVLKLSKGKIGYGVFNSKTKYEVGKITRPDKWDGDIRLECTKGIHFLITKQEAEDYNG